MKYQFSLAIANLALIIAIGAPLSAWAQTDSLFLPSVSPVKPLVIQTPPQAPPQTPSKTPSQAQSSDSDEVDEEDRAQDDDQDTNKDQASPSVDAEQTDSEEGQAAQDEGMNAPAPITGGKNHNEADLAALYLPNLPANPSQIGNYAREYEGEATSSERQYEAMLESNFQAALNRHPFEGPWILEIEGETQNPRFEFRQNDQNKSRIDGAWRGEKVIMVPMVFCLILA